ncbi:hypothetical protein FE257_001803 [Aspergillus nanangensis]|uniref:Uncharacterized protein n=1 Tax=Aspergillus nanangensis TaxID=2582783 RepID=A0AAD4CEL9_ASPNN|nr:hypothetical protein FE257_001803 [Aspergillus nanangensis]
MAEPPPEQASEAIPPVTKFMIWWEFRLYTVYGLILFSIEVGWLATYLTDVYNEPDLLSWPYSPYILPSLWIPIIPAAIGVIWTLAMFIIVTWVPKARDVFTKRWYWAAVTGFRILAAVLFLIGAALKSLYLPLPLGSCDKAYYWRDRPENVPKYTPPIFFMLPERTGKYGKYGPCQRLVSIWGMEIALV